MTSFRKALVVACATSLLGIGAAYAQTDPNATPAAPAATPDASAPAASDTTMAKKPMKKHMMKKHHMKKKMAPKKSM